MQGFSLNPNSGSVRLLLLQSLIPLSPSLSPPCFPSLSWLFLLCLRWKKKQTWAARTKKSAQSSTFKRLKKICQGLEGCCTIFLSFLFSSPLCTAFSFWCHLSLLWKWEERNIRGIKTKTHLSSIKFMLYSLSPKLSKWMQRAVFFSKTKTKKIKETVKNANLT